MSKNEPSGIGLLISKNFEKTMSVAGYFNHGQLYNLAKVKFENGDIYDGNFRFDKLEGKGFYYI